MALLAGDAAGGCGGLRALPRSQGRSILTSTFSSGDHQEIILNKPVVLSPGDDGAGVMTGMMANFLWLSLTLLLLSTVLGKTGLAAVGWSLFGAYWASQPAHYLAISDHFNAALTAATALLCLYISWLIARGRAGWGMAWATRACAICGILYFPFAEIESLQSELTAHTANLTFLMLQSLNIPVALEAGNLLILNGRAVEIVLACTAIESIALFGGVIVSVSAPFSRKAAALLLAVGSIYVLNLGRNAFVLLAYGLQWFGQDSFYLAHNVIAKIGSTLALLLIAYLVMMILPELLTMIDRLFVEIRQRGGRST
ncbi:MAG: Transmembrane exosortase (Exosortase_EpsH) [Methanosaeta sp. PtaB.Bin039]|nr:MAG: Transmembrane exosortase (Exosortase_EpsH) [Methanosaeta sp. PtaB.Bin039]